jgi:hypothetical protein
MNQQFLDTTIECPKHKGQGEIWLDTESMCYGCWLEQFETCPLCGEPWNKHINDKCPSSPRNIIS